MKASPEPETASVASRDDRRGAPVYFVADAHLGIEAADVEREKEADLVRFLSSITGRASALYLLGDVFDFWFEFRSESVPPNVPVLEALRTLSDAGTDVHFLGGNHDYWAGPRLTALTGATVHRDPISVTHFGRRIFAAHGDGLPAGDLGYKLLKAILRSPVSIAAFRLLPPSVGTVIARWASSLSDITEERIRRAIPSMRRFLEDKLSEGYDAALVGHIHWQMMWWSDEGVAGVVGDWMKHRSVVELTETGLRTLSWGYGELVDAPGAPPTALEP